MNTYEKIAVAAWAQEFDGLCDLAEKDGILDPDFSQEKRAAFGYLLVHLNEPEMKCLDKVAFAQLEPIEKIAIVGGAVRVGGRLLSLLGRGTAAVGGRLARVGRAPTRSFVQRLTGRGYKPEQISAIWKQYKAVGPRGWIRMRRAAAPAFARRAPAAVAAAAPHPITRTPGYKLYQMRGAADPALKYMAGRELQRRGARAAARQRAVARARMPAPGPAAPRGRRARPKRERAVREAREEARPPVGRNGGIWPQLRSGLIWGGGFGAAQRVLAPAEPEEVVYGGGY